MSQAQNSASQLGIVLECRPNNSSIISYYWEVQDSNAVLYSRQKSAEAKLYETWMMPTMCSLKSPQGSSRCQIGSSTGMTTRTTGSHRSSPTPSVWSSGTTSTSSKRSVPCWISFLAYPMVRASERMRTWRRQRHMIRLFKALIKWT